jgi:hypothetical protein
MMITYKEHFGKKEEKLKITSPTPPPKGKNRAHVEFLCVLGLPIGYMKFLFPKLFITNFGLS